MRFQRRDCEQGERAQFAAGQLSTGNVIVAGGDQRSGATLSSIESYDPTTEVFSLSGELTVPRGGASSFKASDDSIVYVGG